MRAATRWWRCSPTSCCGEDGLPALQGDSAQGGGRAGQGIVHMSTWGLHAIAAKSVPVSNSQRQLRCLLSCLIRAGPGLPTQLLGAACCSRRTWGRRCWTVRLVRDPIKASARACPWDWCHQ